MNVRRSNLTRVGVAALKSARGAAVIEFALLAPIVLLMVVGAIDFGTFIYQKMQLQSAARAGAQYAIQSDATVTDTAGIATAAQIASELDFTGVTLTTTRYCACSDGDETAVDAEEGCTGDSASTLVCAGDELPGLYVRVNLTGQFTPLFPIAGISNLVSSKGEGVSDLLTLEGEVSLRVP
ncbi:MAG: pilus assembly protein [Proteobacteria bacterium]|nr:pilus assembly protein [Pseudomonadota bacterium]